MDKPNQVEKIRHSLAHLLAMAILEKFPKAKLGIGPTIENGFYYDFALPAGALAEAELPEIEKRIRELIKQNLQFKKEIVSPAEAKKIFKKQPYKLELIEELRKNKKPISTYTTYDLRLTTIFKDLCAGPHIKSAKEINPDAFKLTKIAGAYWKSDEKNPQLTRVYGLAFETPKELENYLKMMEEAEKRDHRKIGQELELFTFDDQVGPGLPLWLPKGTIIIDALEKLAKETEDKSDYQRVRTPHIAKESLYLTSGHLPYYQDSMYPAMEYEGTKYYLRAMNCPHHHKIYASKIRSYRDLPLRLAEYGTVYRHEKSGELFGLMRVRMLQMNDAHIYCAKKQFSEEFNKVNEMYLNYFKIFGINKYVMRFSTHDPKKLGKKYVNEPELWKATEKLVKNVLEKSGIPYVEIPDEAAFYGPKIDVQVWSAIGREFSLATNQVDFSVPKRFNLTYINEKGKEENPICIHRAPLGTHERFIGFLIEHYAGAFPVWLAPVQTAIIPVSEKSQEYAEEVFNEMKKNNLRVQIKNENETLGKRIREAELQKIPYILVVGEKEAQNKSVNVRHRGQPASAKVTAGKESSPAETSAKAGEIKLHELIEKIKSEISEKVI